MTLPPQGPLVCAVGLLCFVAAQACQTAPDNELTAGSTSSGRALGELGITAVGEQVTTVDSLRAMPVTVTETADLTSLSMYHEAARATIGNPSLSGLTSYGYSTGAPLVFFTYAPTPVAGQLVRVSVRHKGNVAGNLKVGVYAGTASAPSTLLAQSNSEAITGTTQTFDLPTPIAVTANQHLWLAAVPSNGALQFRMQSRAAPSGFYKYAGGYVLPSSAGGSTLWERAFNFSAVVEANAPSGHMILGLYGGDAGGPVTLLTQSTPALVSDSAGWQTVALPAPYPVRAGDHLWLAWLYEDNPGIRYTAGAPGRFTGGGDWGDFGGVLPAAFPGGTQADWVYSIYAAAPWGFELGFGPWTNGSGDDADLALAQGPTPSSGTGPSAAFDGDAYVYLETSGAGHPDQTALLDGPMFTGGPGAELSFAYHMYGSEMGALSVDIFDGTDWRLARWTVSGDQGDAWHTATVEVPDRGPVRARFRAVSGSGFRSDIALDALTLRSSWCGNGTLDAGEVCDDGNGIDGDGCDTNCTATACGNGIVTAGEACDGEACCAADCTLSGLGSVCRTAAHSCDVADSCDGVTAGCPDQLAIDGSACAGGMCELGACLPLVLSYQFEEGSGTFTGDLSGLGHHGSLTNAAFVAGVAGSGGMGIGPHDSYVRAPGSQQLELRAAGTIEAWVRPTDLSNRRAIVARRDGYILRLDYGDLELELDGSSRFAWVPLTSTAWSHVAATWDGDRVRLFFDGDLVLDAAQTRAPEDWPSDVLIGATEGGWGGSISQELDGTIDSVRLWAAARSPAGICRDAGRVWDGGSCTGQRTCGDGRVFAEETCDDQNATACDGCDQCNLESATTAYLDGDGDNYGVASEPRIVYALPPAGACAVPDFTALATGDCDDGAPLVNPGAVEVCSDGIDNDCSAGDPVCGVCGNGVTEWAEDCDGGACCGGDCLFLPASTPCDGYRGTRCTGTASDCLTTPPAGLVTFADLCGG